MKINYKWLTEYVDLKVSFDELINRINTQLGVVENVVDFGLKYEGALIVKIKAILDHPQANNLKVCLIDDGRIVKNIPRQKDGSIQVICGALNVKPNMLVVWLPPKTVVPSSFSSSQKIILQAKEIRGLVSYGMLASLSELDLGEYSEAILEIPNTKAEHVGKSFISVYDLDTKIIDIENKMFTQRPDCFGLLGVAREIASITESNFKKPGWYYKTSNFKTASSDKLLKLDIKVPQMCQKFEARLFSDITISDSALELKTRLATVDIKAINNVVDLTNYMMYLSGQPSHVFDYDKLLALSKNKAQVNLIVRTTKPKEKLKLLNGKTLEFDQEALVIATDTTPVALAGIMGGAETEVDDNTKNVLLEVANFNKYDLHRTSMYYGISSEASTRFTKGQSPLQIQPVINFLSHNFVKFGSAKLHDIYYAIGKANIKDIYIEVSAQFINDRLNSDLTASEIKKILSSVEFEVEVDGDDLSITPPFWRMDIEIAEDIVEEIGRLSGSYMDIKLVLPTKPIRYPAIDDLLNLKNKLRNSLVLRGANETINYSFISKDLAAKTNQNLDIAFHVLNPLNPTLEVYRQDLTSSLILAVQTNLNSGYKDFALFEIGSCHQNRRGLVDEEYLPIDLARLALVYCPKTASLEDSFYIVKRYLDILAMDLNIQFDYDLADSKDMYISGIYDLTKTAVVKLNNKVVGLVGLLSDLKLAGFELDLNTLDSQLSNTKIYQSISRFPKSSQDLTLQVDLKINYSQVLRTIESVLDKHRYNNQQISLSPLSIFKSEEMKLVKNISFRIEVSNLNSTTQKQEVTNILDEVVDVCTKTLRATKVV